VKRFAVLQYVQPGLAGLMDGSVSTLAPLFAAAFATHNTWQTFLVGLAASAGAGISMAFAEALSDDGSLTGRGAPVLRGAICGAMTAGSVTLCRFLSLIFHSPFLWPHASSSWSLA
jgi:erythrin-vacuolar iron transport family protein